MHLYDPAWLYLTTFIVYVFSVLTVIVSLWSMEKFGKGRALALHIMVTDFPRTAIDVTLATTGATVKKR